MSRSRYFLLFCVFFISGIFLDSYFSTSLWALFLLAGFIAALVFLNIKERKKWTVLLFIIALLLGFARSEKEKLDSGLVYEMDNFKDKPIYLEGTVSAIPEMKNNKQRLLLDDIKNNENGKKVYGKMMVYLNRYPEYDIKDRIGVKGKISVPENFEGFDYKNYLSSKNIYYISYYPQIKLIGKNNSGFFYNIAGLRSHMHDLIKKTLPQPQAGIMSAMLLGIESDINDDILNAFNVTGTRHLLAISGFNITIIASALMYLLLFLGLKRDNAFYFATLGILFFILLIEFSASAIRAAIMGELILVAVKIGRLSSSTNAIVFAAILMLIYEPRLLGNDIGFQLSFLAVLGLIHIFPRLNDICGKYPDFYGLKTICLVTVSAQIATLPVILGNFGNFSFLSIFANIFILPVAAIVTLGGFAVVALASINLIAAQILSWPVWLILSYQTAVINFFSSISFASVDMGKMSGLWIALYYGILVLALNYKKINSVFAGRTDMREAVSTIKT